MMDQTVFQTIKTKKDIETFLDSVNGLHDGYVIGVQYEHKGHTFEKFHRIDPAFTELKMQILVTSIYNKIVELVFSSLVEWQINDNEFYEILDTAVSLEDNGTIVWADDCSTDPVDRKGGSYVVAKEMKWRFL